MAGTQADSASAGRALPVATLVAVLWLALAGWALFFDQQPAPWSLTSAQWVERLALLLAPTAAVFALAAAIGARGISALPAVISAEGSAEADLAGTMVRLQAMREGLAQDGAALAEHGAALETRIAGARALADKLSETSAGATLAADSLRAVLADAEAGYSRLHRELQGQQEALRLQALQSGETATALGNELSAITEQASQSSDGMLNALGRLSTVAGEGRTRSEEGMKAIRTETDQLFELLENGIRAREDTMRQSSDALRAKIDESWKRFETMTSAAAGGLEQRLTSLSRQADGIDTQLQAQLAAIAELAHAGERTFQLLDARLQHSGQSTHNSLDKLASHVQQVNTDLAGLTAPLKDTQNASDALGSAVASLRESALQTIDILGKSLPETTVQASQAAETMQEELRQLVSAISGAHDHAIALAQPLADGRAAIDSASAHFADQRDAMTTASEALVVELNQARRLLAEVEEQTRDTSLAAATRLVDAMTRVREVAAQATGTMRTMLDGLIDESRESLAQTADAAMRASFVGPVTEMAREAESAAAAAAGRTAQSMAALAQSLKLIEDRTHTQLATLEDARQQEMLAASGLLRERLDSAGVSLAAALEKPMTDADWALWRKGERGLFNRRNLALLERRDLQSLKATIAANPDLKAAAERYSAEFAALTERLPGLANLLHNSDQGRIAAALQEALGD